MINKIESLANIIFGGIFLLLSALIVIETLLRKIFNVSLQGIDELSGYALAVGACLAFTSALIGRSHMRIDILYSKYKGSLRCCLNFISILSLAGFSLFLTYISWLVILETMEYKSTAPTAWGTPLIWPQSFWFLAILLFTLTTALALFNAVKLILTKNYRKLNEEFGPKGLADELNTELQNLSDRQDASATEEPTNQNLVGSKL